MEIKDLIKIVTDTLDLHPGPINLYIGGSEYNDARSIIFKIAEIDEHTILNTSEALGVSFSRGRNTLERFYRLKDQYYFEMKFYKCYDNYFKLEKKQNDRNKEANKEVQRTGEAAV